MAAAVNVVDGVCVGSAPCARERPLAKITCSRENLNPSPCSARSASSNVSVRSTSSSVAAGGGPACLGGYGGSGGGCTPGSFAHRTIRSESASKIVLGHPPRALSHQASSASSLGTVSAAVAAAWDRTPNGSPLQASHRRIAESSPGLTRTRHETPPRPRPPGASPSLYEEACQSRSLLPKFGRAARDGQDGMGEIDMNDLGLGDQHLEALLCDRALVPSERLVRWRLRGNRISGAGLASLAAALPDTTELLDIPRNELGNGWCQGLQALVGLMAQTSLVYLRHIDVSWNALRSDAVALLCSGLIHCPGLLRMELNHNMLQDGAALGKLIGQHKAIVRLSLSSNFLAGCGVAALFRGVLRNSLDGGRLADIDVAWNGLGDDRAIAGAEAIAAVLRDSSVLYHLDLSYNSLDASCCAKIGQGLRDNHCLYGLHLVGNAASVDADGFLVPLKDDAKDSANVAASPSVAPLAPQQPQILSHGEYAVFGDPRVQSSDSRVGVAGRGRKGSKMSAVNDDMLRERDDLEHSTSCWVCEGWERVELEWLPNSGEPLPSAVWVFTSLDNFRAGLRLVRQEGSSKFTAARMVPKGYKVSVVFQVDAALRVPPGMKTQKLQTPAEIELRACEDLPELNPPTDQDVAHNIQRTTSDGQVEHKIVLRTAEAGVIDASLHVAPQVADGPCGRRVVMLDGPAGIGPVQMPRVTETEYRMKTKCARGKSFYAAYKRETEAVVRECFDVDWSRSKMSRIVNSEEHETVQTLLSKNYSKILAIYRHLSAIGVDGSSAASFGVSQIELSDSLTAAGIVDGMTTKISDADRLFITSKVTSNDLKKDMVVRNDKCLVRHQFMEMLVRLADQRYMQTKITSSMSDALGRIIDALGRQANVRVKESHDFFAAFHTDDVDDVYKEHAGVLQAVFKRYSGLKTPPGLAKFMCLAEFQSLLETIGAYDAEFQQRRSATAFRLGMMLQVEESCNSRFQEMTLLEFQHAIAAVVFMRANFVPCRMAELIDEFFKTKLAKALEPHRPPERRGSKTRPGG
eukprot:TRINITY_DN33295_c0_g4_i1.p1 TRINITY_DN33295_c0_g4~~TRINITY_DN33295_c0_g4_i1.p1  ORF type:complete len:1137 (+),score=185.90 TRINITY_DN33295_c0_g4_i1:319-3411(+)